MNLCKLWDEIDEAPEETQEPDDGLTKEVGPEGDDDNNGEEQEED